MYNIPDSVSTRVQFSSVDCPSLRLGASPGVADPEIIMLRVLDQNLNEAVEQSIFSLLIGFKSARSAQVPKVTSCPKRGHFIRYGRPGQR